MISGEDYIPISLLNDFIFCPYSIYLHSVYMEADEGLYQAYPQTKGKIAHESIDRKTYSSRKKDIVSLPVCSESLGLMGKIDIYKGDEKLLMERKYSIKQIFRGQLYQLWAQYYCMKEMGYEVDKLAFYEVATKKIIPIQIPSSSERMELESIIKKFLSFSPNTQIITNKNKCAHCIYCNLCDKIFKENVYT
ncbi:MAG TPA: type V CRISPR-associated protein Cas4 [Candidatus Bacteroides merdigallinarum]|uniref:Type V CRISPR-associated protein Cas4 n=1 Tax=Candidatus Bacteroides merdigallinarum TaxID=2838473 RepID=A0A9D2J1J5_9BACE|nr:type V CRISPR-associated protein Cas4 [Candidatus Bacteroides merdigallinarum]